VASEHLTTQRPNPS